ncbi:uncharacterized protein LOC111641803 [Centruroides sculpturatus]|uniref:uncharacterized protein LOC111641803 n=1 Tax=Centruroides sculpturatus TaxID=218467 RepID=UPI000C6D9482|nr:uncharacterized protein LOC111641803 [Centruroides sculpturatus]XP_023243803.1 uncharacterized protein LOC111641803 [Centruroides sculpturatus]
MYERLLFWSTVCLLVIGKINCDSVKQANNYLDNVLALKLKRSDQIKNIKLPEFNTESRDRILFITSRVRTSYSKGDLHNLENVVRLGDCLPHSTVVAKSVECTLQFKHLRAEYQASLKYGRLPKIPIRAKALMKPIDAKIEVESRVPRNIPELIKFQLITPIEIDVSYKGMGFLNRYLRILKNDFVEKMRNHLYAAINNDFKAELKKSLSLVDLKL